MAQTISEYHALFLHSTPLFDVRAPIEFAKGAFPAAVNLPLMDDAERHRVGICYTREGPEAAVALGHRLVSGEVRAARVAAWAAFARKHPDGALYCFRGGLRSQIAQQWLREDAGIDYPRVEGGYKALRTFLIDTLEAALNECRYLVLGGLTGTGKTELLAALPNALDLEHHAHHRGSSFGRHALPQPPQIGFENAVAIDLLRKRAAGLHDFVIEDEGRMVGSRAVPPNLYAAMQRAPMVWLEDSHANRVERILRDYVTDLCAEFTALHGAEEGLAQFGTHLLQSLDRIARRLGGERHARLRAVMQAALDRQAATGDVALHRDWIAALLSEYYDPLYDYQRRDKADRILFAGQPAEVRDYLLQRSCCAAPA